MAGCRYDRLVRILSVLVPAAVGGCTDREGIDETQFEARLCNGGELDLMRDIQPADPVDYAELRETFEWGGEQTPPPPNVLDATGEICGAATDPEACRIAFEDLPTDSELVRHGFEGTSQRSVAYTRGDEVAAITREADLRAFLGQIDSPGDAGLLAVAQFHSLICDGRDNAAEVEDGYLLFTLSGGGCGEGDHIKENVLHVSPDGTIELIDSEIIQAADPNCAVGRLPHGLCRARARRSTRTNPVGRFFARVAELEAAAVPAFEQLRVELLAHRAPAQLQRRAGIARRDEIRHARVMATIAKRYGARPAAPRVAPWRPRPLVDVATDNAIEGCVRETYGAAVATLQARRATDPLVRRRLAAIARDETRHAALSWDLHDWVQQRLYPAQRSRVAQQAADAVDRLRHELTAELPPEVHRVAGMPDPAQARALFDGLRRELLRM